MRNRTTREIIIIIIVVVCLKWWKCGSVEVCKCASVQVCKCASVQVCRHLMQIFMKLLPSWVQRRVDHRGRVSVVGKLGCHQVRHYRHYLQAL